MSATGRPEREYRSAKREYRSAKREGAPSSATGRPSANARDATLLQ